MPVSIVGYSTKEVSSLAISEAESLRSGRHMILALVRAYPSCIIAWLMLHEESLWRRERAPRVMIGKNTFRDQICSLYNNPHSQELIRVPGTTSLF